MDGRKADDSLDDIAKKIDGLQKFVCEQTNDLQKALQEILRSRHTERCDRELKDKDITNKTYTPQARIEGKENHTSEGRNIVWANKYRKSSAKKSNCNRVHPSPTADTAAFAKASKTVQIVRSVASYISDMKHSKQQPKTLEDQYDSALERLYLKEWPDAVPKHENESCCSHCSMICSSEWDSKSRKMFKKVFP